MDDLYLDHAATSYPKPPAVLEAMSAWILDNGASPNRGSYARACRVSAQVFEARQHLAQFFGAPDARNVIFGANATEGINLMLKGLLKSGDHVLVSTKEHNAVMRPLHQLEDHGVTFTRIAVQANGQLDLAQARNACTPHTKALIVTHASNVSGEVLDLARLGTFCREQGIFLLVDTAQSAGILPIHMEHDGIDGLAFTGHKGLMGPQGIGGCIMSDRLIQQVEPLIVGGTGSVSHEETVPTCIPDRFEAGTPNTPGILGLHAGLAWVEAQGLSAIYHHERTLIEMLEAALEDIGDELVRIIKPATQDHLGVLSLQTPQHDLARVAFELDKYHHILVRVGMHCAPAAHKALGTYPTGTLRFSVGMDTTVDDIARASHALRKVLSS